MAPRAHPDESPDALFAAAEQALDDGRPEEALSLAERLGRQVPEEPAVAALQAAAFAQLDRLEEAEKVLEAARKRHPEDLELLYALAELWVLGSGEDRPRVEAGLSLCAKGVKQARKAGDVELHFEFLLLEGTGLNQLGECAVALERLDAALALRPPSLEARVERAMALFELCRFAEAEKALLQLAQEVPEDAWVQHTLGLLAERKKDAKAAARCFARAQQLAPEDFPPPVALSDEEFDQAVEAAVAKLPPHVKEHLENTPITVEEIPSDEDLLSSRPPLSPIILGLFRGEAVTQSERFNQGGPDPVLSTQPFRASIVLYQRNLERFARTREELIEQIGITVMHEVGHLIGLDEEDLWERGLE